MNLHRLDKLKELAGFEPNGRFEDNLYRLTCITGDAMAARRVSLMLLDTDSGKGVRLKLAAVYGELPEVAWRDDTPAEQGIAQHVLELGQCLHVQDIGHSRWRSLARRLGGTASFIACPIQIAGKVAGVLNVSEPIERAHFTRSDLDTAEFAARLIGRSIHAARLDRMLDSRFAQMAFTLEGRADACSVVSMSSHEPDKVARMLAKAFFKEMRHCGFTPNQIIRAAGEIISELTGSLNRHKHRLDRE
ncbi:MAG: GAF domain-containing protein [Pseudomonadota bacterium]|nr:GAF domain-containing protein [Pseudomonadota bacterium]MDP1906059.1 GAF domain-containing protein [Pseudomonadota bacterium]MDP2352529.1 GAF domain-containing protein [Pseudomonadota bacterium]